MSPTSTMPCRKPTRRDRTGSAAWSRPSEAAPKPEKRQPQRTERQLARIERELGKTEEQLAALDREAEEYASDYQKLLELEEKRAALNAALDELYAQWEAIGE